MAAGMPQLRRGTRERRPSMKAAAASTPAGVDGKRGDTPPKKRCAESQQPLQLRQRAQRRRLDALPHHQQTPQGSTATFCMLRLLTDRTKRARKAPARFDDISFAPPSGTQDNAEMSTPSARTGRGSRRSQHRRRCPASASPSSGRRTAPTPAASRRAKPISLPSPSPQSPVQHIALGGHSCVPYPR